MPEQQRSLRGRPKLSSQETLEEAAFELFLENGYAGTTVEQITRRAGVSRNTFFNYFAGKGDVFWVGLDESIGNLARTLSAMPADVPAVDGIRRALLEVAATLGPSQVPWALTHRQLIGSSHEIVASLIDRMTTLNGLLSSFAASRLADADPDDALPRTMAFVSVAAVLSAATSWAAAGPVRGNLARYIELAIVPSLRGFAG